MSIGHFYRVSNDPKDEGTYHDSNKYYLTAEQQRELNNHGSCGVQEQQHKDWKSASPFSPFQLSFYNLQEAVGEGFYPTCCPFCGFDCVDATVVSSSEPIAKYTDVEHILERQEVVRCPKCFKLLLFHNSN